ncbi:MAG: ABC transporter permease [Clostridium sp.]|nr:ABC transporter permease [Clostridium sp.]
MFRVVRSEIWKLKRYHMIWAGVLLMLLSVLLTLFTTTAINDDVWTFSFFTEQVIKNNFSMIFPMCISLIAGYIIVREERDDTLKSILTVPVFYRRLLWGKLLVCALVSVFLGFISAVFTVAANLFMGFPGFSAAAAAQTFVQIIANCLFLYIAVMPVIAFTARMANGHMIGTIVAFVYGYGGMFAAGSVKTASIYPITASLGLIGYRNYDPAVHWNMTLCLGSMSAAFALSVLFVLTIKGKESGKNVKKSKKVIMKKGW